MFTTNNSRVNSTEAQDNPTLLDTEVFTSILSTLSNDTDQSYGTDWYVTADVLLYIIIGIIGVLGNAIVIIIIASSRSMMMRITNILIVNQSSIDFVCSAFVIGHSTIRYNSKGYVGLADELLCLLWTSKVLQWSAFVSSTYNHVALTLDKYLQITHPIYHRVAVTRRKTVLLLIMVWLSGPMFNFPITVPTSEVKNGVCLNMQRWPNEATRRFIGILTVVVEYIIPLFIIILSYYKISAVMRRRVEAHVSIIPVNHGEQRNQNEPKHISREGKMARARKNVVRTLMTSSVSFVLCWTWNQGFFLLFNLGFPVDYNGTFYHFTVFMVFLNVCTNPFIYAFKYNQYQERLKRLCCRRGTRVEDSFSQA